MENKRDIKSEIKQEKTLNTWQVARQIGGMRLSQFYSLAEDEFSKLVKEVESDPLFKQLMYSDSKVQKVVSYKRFTGTDLSTKFYELNENITIDNTTFDIDSFLGKREEVISIIKKLNADKFKQYFLYNENKIPDEEIAGECELTIPEMQKIKDFVNDLAINTEFYHPSTISPENRVHYSKIASIEKDASDGFVVGYFSPVLARGRYSINHERIENLKREGIFSKEELRRLNKLLRNLELINKRKTTVYQIIQHIIKTQVEYLRTANKNKTNFLVQKDLSNKINVHPSVICRMIKHRSIEMPWGEEKPLKFFFSNRKEEIQSLIKDIIKEEKDKLRKELIFQAHSDEKIRNRLASEYKINIARRTVREYRKELGIPAGVMRNER